MIVPRSRTSADVTSASYFLHPKEMFDGFLVTLLKSHIDDGVKDDATPIDDVEEDAQAWLFEASVKLEFSKYKKRN